MTFPFHSMQTISITRTKTKVQHLKREILRNHKDRRQNEDYYFDAFDCFIRFSWMQYQSR